jgi:hypothetical protein
MNTTPGNRPASVMPSTGELCQTCQRGATALLTNANAEKAGLVGDEALADGCYSPGKGK